MRRTAIILSASLMLLGLGPASALARHHGRHHRSHTRHARLLRFGDTSSSTSSSSADSAGTVASFTGGFLTINTSDGPIRGAVTDQTECMPPSQSQTMHEDGDNGGGGDQSGDGDHSGSGDDQGQDHNDANEANEANDNDANDNDTNEANENEANEDQDDDAGMSCTPTTVPVGTVVREAVLRISGAGKVWMKVEFGS